MHIPRPTIVATAVFAATALVAAAVTAATVAGQATASGRGDAQAPDKTATVVVRPVDAQGNPAHGWSVSRMKGVVAECAGAAQFAVDDGIYDCAPGVAHLAACWPSQGQTVLCLQSAFDKTLSRVAYRGSLGTATAPASPTPVGLSLADGQECDARVDGAWPGLPTHPRWLGFFACDKGLVYGPPNGDGIAQASQPWTVREWKKGTKGTVVSRAVSTAFLVGTAA